MITATTQTLIQTVTREIVAGRQASGNYLQLLVREVQTRIGEERGKRFMLDAVKAVHTEFYAVVAATIGDAVDAVERNRRGTFARSAASTLRSYIKAGGPVWSLDADTVSKMQLRRRALPPEARHGSRHERAYGRASEATARIAARIARDNPKAAAERLRATIEVLQAQLDKMSPKRSQASTTSRRTATRPVRTPHRKPAARVQHVH